MKENKGITLIALIITIIVLLILAGVSISLVVGENGILGRAVTSKEKSEVAEAKERVWLEVDGSYDETGKINLDDLNNGLMNNLEDVYLKVQNDDGTEGEFQKLSEDNKIKRLPATVKVKDNGEEIEITGGTSSLAGETGTVTPSKTIPLPEISDGDTEIDEQPVIGEVIVGSTTLKGGWKYFYSEGDNVYLIYGDYLESGAIPKDYSVTIGRDDSNRHVYAGSNRTQLLTYLKDTSKWADIVSGVKSAMEKAIGTTITGSNGNRWTNTSTIAKSI